MGAGRQTGRASWCHSEPLDESRQPASAGVDAGKERLPIVKNSIDPAYPPVSAAGVQNLLCLARERRRLSLGQVWVAMNATIRSHT
jgi:hypothetical protein